MPGRKTPQTNSFVPSYPGKPFPDTVNPTWGQDFQSNSPFPGDLPNQQDNVGYFTQNPLQLNLTGLCNYLQTTYGPTGIPTGLPPQNYQFHQVNIQLLFLATLNLSYLSRILNYPISHPPYWLVMPTKLPSYIPKFEN